MKSIVKVCRLCLRSDVKYYQLQDAIRSPSDLHFNGCTELQDVLQTILKANTEVSLSAPDVCQECRSKFREIYSFVQKCTESEKTRCQLAEVTVEEELTNSREFNMVTAIKTETEEYIDDFDEIADHTLESCSSEKDKRCESLANSYLSPWVVKEECDVSFEGTIDAADALSAGPSSMENIPSNTEQIAFDYAAEPCEGIKNVQQDEVKDDTAEGIDSKKHTKQPKGDLTYECDQCNAKYKTLYSWKAHKQSHSGEMFQCDQCDHQFAGALYLKSHKKNYHTGKKFECDVCQSRFTTSKYLVQHKRSHTGMKYKCNECGKEFKIQRSLRYHKRSHTGEYFKCDQCDARFLSNHYLQRHIRIHSSPTLACDQCDAKYCKQDSLYHHKIAAHSNEVYKCDQCDATYKTKNSLKYHQSLHTGVLIKCDQCDDGFETRQELRQHKKSHPIVVFECDQCDSTFKRKESLLRHILSHTGTRFECDLCDNKFSSESSLKNHKKLLHIGGSGDGSSVSDVQPDKSDAILQSTKFFKLHKSYVRKTKISEI